MKRLTFIYWACPLMLALSSLPPFFGPAWGLAVAGALAVGLWAVVWLRLYGTRKLRPEFSLLCVLPQMCGYVLGFLQRQSPEAALAFRSAFWQNLHLVLWMGLCWVGIYALLPDENGKKAWKDPVTLLMSGILLLYSFTLWGASAFSLFLPPQ